MEKLKDKTKIRIAVVIPRYYPVFGGAENQCRLLNRYLLASRKVCIPFIVTKLIERKSNREEFIDGIFVKRLGFHGSNRWSEYYFYLSAFFTLLINRNKFDVVHCHATSIVGFMMTVVGRILKKPVILKLSTNGELLRMTGNTKKRGRFPLNVISQGHKLLAAFTVKHAHVIALNQEGRDELVLSCARRLHLIPNGVDISLWKPLSAAERVQLRSRYQFGSNDFVFVYTGRFVKRKGINTLIDGYRKFSKRLGSRAESVHLFLVGDDTVQQDYSTKQFLGTFDCMTLKNVQVFNNSNNVSEYLQLSDAFVFASYNEGLPNSVLEAIAAGLPCVLSDIRPHLELMNQHQNQGHYLFKAGSSTSLADALMRCHSRLVLDGTSRSESTVYLDEQYAINAVAQRYIQLYETVINI